ncbi:hypothetical protein Mycch_3058 [Mycolicibacterium chubuense NBB4]|uniref:Uncharacterized protein n=1 Tax=Mycolicibacterium chubuense (strain NBB4) TaxID=710421 RepID=I4BKK2_MYCCN|nr:hypothetical protein [Mycolicibacterium chubuense]AFM17809.1 hypothetical protein Mycch_3058 [Mycolicibacterium chubuense NBB4]
MTDLATNFEAQPTIDLGAPATAAAPPPPLITEQEVLLGSAAALAAPTVGRRSLRLAVRALFTSSRPEGVPRHYPTHYSFIEDAAMAREMYRL